MKYCATCNTQYEDSQNFCPICGKALETYQPKPVAPVATEAEPKKTPLIVTLLSFGSKAFSVFAAMFAACALAAPYIYTSIRSGYYSGYYASTYFHPEESCSILALLLSLTALGAAVATLIIGLIKKLKLEKLFNLILNTLIPFALTIVSIVLLANL